MDAPIHHNINSDTIFINNRNDNSDAHINISTKGALGDNDLHLKDCNVELDSGFVKAPTMKTTSIQDINGINCLTLGANSIDFHNKTAANLSLGVGSISANSVTSENGYASLDAELDALTTNKVSITGHTPSKIFVSSGGGGVTTSSIASSQLSNIATNTASISTINSDYVSKSSDSLIDLATLTVGDDPDGNNGGIQLRRVVNLGLGQVAFGKLKLPTITANKEYTFPDDTCTLAKKASVDTNVSSISTNSSSISTNTSNIATNASNISSNTSNITTNASGISTNTSSISSNASGIATNVTNITANTNKLAPITNLNGNIGIGESFPNKLLTLHNSSRVDIKFDTGDEDHYIRKDGNYLRFRGHDDSTILFELQNNNSVTNNSKPSNNICCFPSGNVGIGTSSPLSHAKLHVKGTLFLGDGSGLTDGTLGGCIDFESRDSINYSSTKYSSALIGTRTHNDTGGTQAGIDKMEMVFFMGNNADSYGPDRFHFIGPEFRVTAVAQTPTSNTFGHSVLDEVGELYENTTPNFIIKSSGNVGIGDTSPGAPLHISYANGNYNNGSQGFINEATSGRSTTRLRSTTNNPCELFFDVNGAARWDFSCRNSNNNYDLMIFKQQSTPSLGSVSGPVMTLTQTGRLGIGTSTPSYPLEINGSVAEGGVHKYFSSTVNWLNSGGGNRISVRASHFVRCDGLIHDSDERIKENISEIDDSYSLKKVRDINCVWYNYKDKVSRGNVRVAGFIAQQVREHLPAAVSVTRDFLPNEMRHLEDISWNGEDMTCESLSDVSGVKYRFYVSNDLSGNEEMKEITGNQDNSFTLDASYNNVFCYGKEVDDFHILDKQKLFALNFSATQELDRKVIALQQENDILKARLTILESKINLST